MAALTAGLVFANTLQNGFVSDDEQLVLLNPWIIDARFLPEVFSSSAWGFLGDTSASNYYRPLLHVMYLAIHGIFGLSAWGFHLVNVLLHVANTIAVFFVTARLTTREERLTAIGNDAPGPDPLAVPFVAALLFATHPIHTEAVNWVASIQELSFTLLYLLSFHLYIVAGDERVDRRFVSAGLFFLALLCKETALTLPALLVVYDVALGSNEKPKKNALCTASTDVREARSLRRRRMHAAHGVRSDDHAGAGTSADALRRYSPYLLAIAIYAVLRTNALSGVVPAGGVQRLGLVQAIINLPPLFTQHMEKLLLPVGLNFRPAFHPISSLLSIDGLLGLAVVGGFLVALAAAWKRDRLILLCLALIVMPLLPTFYINALAVNPFAERFLYLPSVGFVILAALSLSRLSRLPRMRVAAGAIVAVTVVLYAGAAVSRNRVWRDAYTLYSDTATRNPDAPTPPYELTMALLGRGRVDEALAHLRILVEVHPGDVRYQSAFGNALRVRGRTQEAIAAGRRALELDPDFAEAHYNLAGALADAGEKGQAIEHYRTAVRLQPSNAYYRNVLGIEYGKSGSVDEAIDQFEEAVRLAESEPAYRRNLDRARNLATPGQADRPDPTTEPADTGR